MAHKMGLIQINMAKATAPETRTYTTNSVTTAYDSGNVEFYALNVFDGTNLPYSASCPGTVSYFIVKHSNGSYSFTTPYKALNNGSTTGAVSQWTMSAVTAPASGKCTSATTSDPMFKNLGRLYSYTGTSQTYSAILSGFKYQMECWGAEGGNAGVMLGGMGAYTKGSIVLGGDRTSVVYVYCGGHDEACNGTASVAAQGIVPASADYSNAAQNTPGGWNGGGSGGWDGDTFHTFPEYANGNRGTSGTSAAGLTAGGGGGATDIRLANGEWNTNLSTRIMVAGGGGGGQGVYQSYTSFRTPTLSSAGGGLNGYNGMLHGSGSYPYSSDSPAKYVTGGTQDNGGSLLSVSSWSGDKAWSTQDDLSANGASECLGKFGEGGKGNYGVHAWGGGGGGGGYYGGAGGVSYQKHYAGNSTCGAGGSSFIPGHIGCASSITYGGQSYSFISGSTLMIDGLGRKWSTTSPPAENETTTIPNPDSSPTTRAFGEPVTGRVGNGCARITLTPYD